MVKRKSLIENKRNHAPDVYFIYIRELTLKSISLNLMSTNNFLASTTKCQQYKSPQRGRRENLSFHPIFNYITNNGALF